ncbi:GNAT family N-acetyltransferase [Lysobacter sp. CA196]|uniref:GNAT family N-acetyltransferase n=1 Tax=Lysobacter sp. CA196 TaxID=3455606 RepID=UPI003F8D2357
MSALVERLCAERIEAALSLDGSFLVDSRLSLHARDGVIDYELVPLPPYRKRYRDEADDDDLRDYLATEDRIAFVAIERGEVIGRVLVSTSWNGYAMIDDIAVDAGHRRSGAGAALLDRAIAWAREGGYPGLMLETQDHNVAACRFYARQGFVLGGFDRFHYRHDAAVRHETALFWYLDLASQV